jgi:hypothetical protein
VRARLNSKSLRVPGAAQREAVRCRPGTVTGSECGTVPDLRRTVTLRSTLHRVRETGYFPLMCIGSQSASSGQKITSASTTNMMR